MKVKIYGDEIWVYVIEDLTYPCGEVHDLPASLIRKHDAAMQNLEVVEQEIKRVIDGAT